MHNLAILMKQTQLNEALKGPKNGERSWAAASLPYCLIRNEKIMQDAKGFPGNIVHAHGVWVSLVTSVAGTTCIILSSSFSALTLLVGSFDP